MTLKTLTTHRPTWLYFSREQTSSRPLCPATTATACFTMLGPALRPFSTVTRHAFCYGTTPLQQSATRYTCWSHRLL